MKPTKKQTSPTLFLLLTLLIPLSFAFAQLPSQSDYTIYSDGSYWLGYNRNGDLISNNTAFSDTFQEVHDNASVWNRIDCLGSPVIEDTLNITKSLHITMQNLTMTADKNTIHINGAKTYVASLTIDHLKHNVTRSNSTVSLLIENSWHWTVYIGLIDNEGATHSGIGVELLALDGEGVMENHIKLGRVVDCWEAFKIYSEGDGSLTPQQDGWINENTLEESCLCSYTNINITQTGMSASSTNNFREILLNNAQYGIWLKGKVYQSTFYSIHAWDWKQGEYADTDPLVYYADSSVRGTRFYGGMIRTDVPAFWDDNGENTLIVGDWQPDTGFYFEGLPTPDPTPTVEDTSDQDLLVQFIIVIVLVSIIGGAIGIRRYW